MRYTIIIILLNLVLRVPYAIAEMPSTFTLPSGIEVKIIEDNFQKMLFKVEGCSARDFGCKINGNIPFGSAFGLPKTYVKSITIYYQGVSYSLDVSNMYNAWGKRPLEYKGSIRYFGGKCFNKKHCQVRGLLSDAAGSFVAEWLIVNGISIRTVLTNSNDIVNLFTTNIDPPEFD